jgi:hypothetical protein
MVKGKGDEWEERTDGIMQILRAVCLKCTPSSTHLFSFPLIYLSSLQMARVYSTQRRNQQHSMSCASTHCTPSSYLPLQLPTARSTAQLHQHATRFRSHTNQTHSTVTASSFPRGGTAGGKLRSYETASTRKHGVRRGNTISSLVSTVEGAKQARRNSTLRSYKTKVPRHAFSISYYVALGQLTTIADATPTTEQSNTGASLPREELRRERATCRSRPSRHFPQSRRPLRSASCRPRRTTGFVDLLAAGGRTGTCRDGRRW